TSRLVDSEISGWLLRKTRACARPSAIRHLYQKWRQTRQWERPGPNNSGLGGWRWGSRTPRRTFTSVRHHASPLDFPGFLPLRSSPFSKRAEDPALEGWGEQRVRVGVWETTPVPQSLRDAPPVERWRDPRHQRTCQTGTAGSSCPVGRVRPRNPPPARHGGGAISPLTPPTVKRGGVGRGPARQGPLTPPPPTRPGC